MDNKLIYPIVFDLDKGIEDAGRRWEESGADRLEKRLSKRPVKVKLALDFTKLDRLEEVKKKLAELKIQPLTPENKAAIKELTKELTQLAKGLSRLNNLKGVQLPELQRARAAQINKQVEQADEKLRLAQERLRISQERLTMAQQKAETQAHRTSGAYRTQETYVSRLLKRMAVYASFSAVVNFAKQLREVTAQFELQRVSLGAILQDTNKATLLWGQLKGLALESPATLMDLTKYTKQLAAYKIDYEDLFDTTKRLTDVSVGLGVAMDRVILAYGQTRATGHLRSAELRQYTELGIPITEELAKKLSAMNGELVTAADVMKMVSERAISFNLVKEVFDDMTSAGGIFYNMQEKQANTLYGVYAKLGDAYQIMLNKIGEGGAINSVLKGIAEAGIFLMKNVDALATTLGLAAGGLAAYKLGWVKLSAVYKSASGQYAAALSRSLSATTGLKNAQTQLEASNLALTKSQDLLNTAQAIGTQQEIAAAEADLKLAQTRQTLAQQNLAAAEKEQKAAQKNLENAPTTGRGAVWKSLKAGIGSMALWGGILAAVTAIFAVFKNWYDEATKLRKELNKIKDEFETTSADGASRFTMLANAATQAADGSAEQRKALEELNRTYGDIIPAQDLQIEKLRAMKGNYDLLTQAIRENAATEAETKGIAAVYENYGEKLRKERKSFQNALENVLTSKSIAGLFEGNAKADAKNITEIYTDNLIKGVKNPLQEAMKVMGYSKELIAEVVNSYNKGTSALTKYSKTFNEQQAEIKAVQNMYRFESGNFGKYNEYIQAASKAMGDLATNEKKAARWLSALNEVLASEGEAQLDLSKYVTSVDFMSETLWSEMADKLGDSPASKKALDKIQREVAKLFDASLFTRQIKRIGEEINQEFFDGLFNWGSLTIKDNETEEEYVKRLKEKREALENLKDKEYQTQLKDKRARGEDTDVIDKQIKKAEDNIKAIDKMLSRLNSYDKPTSIRSGSEQDPWVILIKNRLKFMEDFQKGVEDLNKTMQFEDALFATQQTMVGRGAEFGIVATDLAGTRNELIQYYDDTIKDIRTKISELNLPEFADIANNSVMAILKTDTVSQVAIGYKKLLAEIWESYTDFISKKQAEDLKRALAKLAEDVSRSKEAKEFYEKILGQTGDIKLAERVTTSIYGHLEGKDVAKELYDKQREEIVEVFKSKEQENPIDLSGVFDDVNMRINYGKLMDIYDEYSEQLIEANRGTAQKIAKDGSKASQQQILDMLKVFEKAKDFEQRRTDIIDKAYEERKRIIKSHQSQPVKEQLIELSRQKERKDLANLEVEEFKSSESYVRIFQDLDNATTETLQNLRGQIEQMMQSATDMNPQNMKLLAKAIEDIDKSIEGRGFGRTFANGVKEYVSAIKQYQKAKENLLKAENDYVDYSEQIEVAKKDVEAAQKMYDTAKSRLDYVTESNGSAEDLTEAESQMVEAHLQLNDAQDAYNKLVELQAKEEENITDAQNGQKEALDNMLKGRRKMLKGFKESGEAASELADILGDVKDLFGVTSDSAEGVAFDSAIEGLQNMASLIGIASAAMAVFNAIANANPFVAIASAVLAIGLMMNSYIKNSRIAAANAEIERQEKLLEQLEYAYQRTELAAEKAFGADYLREYNAQLNLLYATAKAYDKQLKAERSKGKRADEKAIKEYSESYRDTMDEIRDMQGKVAERMLGTDLTSAARDFADAWLEAYLSFENTADAMSDKFDEMIQNMIAESLIAKVMKIALQPTFDMIEKMSGADIYDEQFWKRLSAEAEQGAMQADAGANAAMQWLESMGMSLGGINSEATGIAKNVSTATSEEINALAAGINTQNFYMSYVPQIYALMQQMNLGQGGVVDNDSLALQQQAMAQRAAIEANTAATVRELQNVVARLDRVITYKGGSYGVKTIL